MGSRGFHRTLLVAIGVILTSVQTLAADVGSQGSNGIRTQPGNAAPSPLPWDDPKRREDGIEQYYKSGNTHLSLQIQYIQRKLTILQALKAEQDFAMRKAEAAGKTAVEDQRIREALGPFCFTNESSEKCFKRFVNVQELTLLRMRNAIVKNSDSAAQLNSVQASADVFRRDATKSADEVPYFDRRDDITQRDALLIPHVSTLEELLKQYNHESGKLAQTIRQDYQRDYYNWVASLERAPALKDFVKWEEIPRDPTKPAGEKLLVIKRNPDGSIQYDKQAFELAKRKHAAIAETKDYEDANPLPSGVPESERKKLSSTEVMRLQGPPGRDKKPPEKMTMETVGIVNEAAYAGARVDLLNATSKSLKDLGLIANEVHFGGDDLPPPEDKPRGRVPASPNERPTNQARRPRGNSAAPTSPTRAADAKPTDDKIFDVTRTPDGLKVQYGDGSETFKGNEALPTERVQRQEKNRTGISVYTHPTDVNRTINAFEPNKEQKLDDERMNAIDSTPVTPPGN